MLASFPLVLNLMARLLVNSCTILLAQMEAVDAYVSPQIKELN